MPNIVFKDSALEKEFNDKGYVKVSFLTLEEIEHLKKMFFETISESGGPKTSGEVDFDSKAMITYDFTFIDRNTDYKKKVFTIITEIFQKKADAYLNNYTPIIANYIRKKEGGGEVPMHQNWAFVEEEKYTSVSIWVPLVDSDEENGTLQVVEGSHKKFGRLRGPMIPWELEPIKEKIIKNHLTPMNVKAGEGIILDDSIVHYSNINKTPGLRLAIQLIMIPSSTTSVHYHLDRNIDQTKVHVLETDLDFYMNFHPWLKPEGKRELKTEKFLQKPLSYEQFLTQLKGRRFDGEKGILRKVADLFK
jgi:ectoine hydroxylase-related dioxygenase (phytanoyl-CoA dioxygenase family)